MIVFDTGALIALERRRQRALVIVDAARRAEAPILVPGPVIAEWWRGRTDRREAILEQMTVVAIGLELGVAAGEAVAATPGATVVEPSS